MGSVCLQGTGMWDVLGKVAEARDLKICGFVCLQHNNKSVCMCYFGNNKKSTIKSTFSSREFTIPNRLSFQLAKSAFKAESITKFSHHKIKFIMKLFFFLGKHVTFFNVFPTTMKGVQYQRTFLFLENPSETCNVQFLMDFYQLLIQDLSNLDSIAPWRPLSP